MDMVNEAKNFGVITSAGKFDWPTLKEARDSYITRLNGIYERNLGNSGVKIIQGVSTDNTPRFFRLVVGSQIWEIIVAILTGCCGEHAMERTGPAYVATQEPPDGLRNRVGIPRSTLVWHTMRERQ